MAFGDLGDVLRRAGGDDPPAALAAFRAEVQHPIGGLDDLQIVLDHHHRVALLHQRVQHFQQLADILEMQAGRRLIEDVQRAAGGTPGKFLRQLDALGLTARQRRGLLAEMDVAEPHITQHHQLLADRGDGGEELHTLIDRHVQHIGDGLALELHLQGFPVVAFPFAGIAGDVDVGQEVHLDL